MTNPLGFIRTMWRRWVTHRDRVAPIEVRRQYGWNAEIADRPWKKQHDLEAPLVNANVSIATRAIVDAISSLSLHIVSVVTVGNVEREEEDRDHPANGILNEPNPELTLREVVAHSARSYLNDGNAILTIERLTGPNDKIEIWPRDPRPPYVRQRLEAGRVTGYDFSTDARSQVFYPKERVIHIRDMAPEDPLWGVSRIESVRDEIYMDYLINQFNKNFFDNAGGLLAVWSPKDKLTETQHQLLLEKWEARKADPTSFFRPFISPYAGDWSTPISSHKDIAFGDLAKTIRERIFGVFGLPPFRGGVMEYANYANALAQDKDFWNNTIRPITQRFEDALNKQLIWRFWDRDVALRFDYSTIPALKGEPKEQAEIFAIYVEKGIMTANEVREQLNMDPLDEEPTPKPGDDTRPEDNPDEAPEPSRDEEDETANALLRVFNAERSRLRESLSNYTCGGRMMSRLSWPDREAARILGVAMLNERLEAAVMPVVNSIGRRRGALGRSLPKDGDLIGLSQMARNELLMLAQESSELLRGYLADAQSYGWTLSDLTKRVNGIFNAERARNAARQLVSKTVREGEAVALTRRIAKPKKIKEAKSK